MRGDACVFCFGSQLDLKADQTYWNDEYGKARHFAIKDTVASRYHVRGIYNASAKTGRTWINSDLISTKLLAPKD